MTNLLYSHILMILELHVIIQLPYILYRFFITVIYDIMQVRMISFLWCPFACEAVWYLNEVGCGRKWLESFLETKSE